MARKKRRIGKILGAIAGSPYERLLKQVDKLVETSVNERMLAKNLEKLVSITAENYDEEKIDEEEHEAVGETPRIPVDRTLYSRLTGAMRNSMYQHVSED